MGFTPEAPTGRSRVRKQKGILRPRKAATAFVLRPSSAGAEHGEMQRQVSWLAPGASPSHFRRLLFMNEKKTAAETVAGDDAPTREAYSCGDSSGFEPDSLFSLAPQSGSGNLYRGKDRWGILEVR